MCHDDLRGYVSFRIISNALRSIQRGRRPRTSLDSHLEARSSQNARTVDSHNYLTNYSSDRRLIKSREGETGRYSRLEANPSRLAVAVSNLTLSTFTIYMCPIMPVCIYHRINSAAPPLLRLRDWLHRRLSLTYQFMRCRTRNGIDRYSDASDACIILGISQNYIHLPDPSFLNSIVQFLRIPL